MRTKSYWNPVTNFHSFQGYIDRCSMQMLTTLERDLAEACDAPVRLSTRVRIAAFFSTVCCNSRNIPTPAYFLRSSLSAGFMMADFCHNPRAGLCTTRQLVHSLPRPFDMPCFKTFSNGSDAKVPIATRQSASYMFVCLVVSGSGEHLRL
jgi:hypothetical protein